MLLNKVNELLSERGMTLVDLAKKMNADQSNLKSRLTSGNPTLSSLKKIADALEVPVRYLLPDEPVVKPEGTLTMNKRQYAIVPEYFFRSVPSFDPKELEQEVYKLISENPNRTYPKGLCGVFYNCSFAVIYDPDSKNYLLVCNTPSQNNRCSWFQRYELNLDTMVEEEVEYDKLAKAIVSEMKERIFGGASL